MIYKIIYIHINIESNYIQNISTLIYTYIMIYIQDNQASFSAWRALMLTLLIFTTLSLDLDTGNAGLEVIIPTIVPLAYQDISLRASDPTLILRLTTMTTLSWFDAVAPYHQTAVGIYTQHSHRLIENTNRNKNIAMLYACYHIALIHLPKRKR